MLCPACNAAELVPDTRDMPYEADEGETLLIPQVHGLFCPACGEALLDNDETLRTAKVILGGLHHIETMETDE